MKILATMTRIAATALLTAISSVAVADEPQLDGTVNVISVYRTLNATTWDYYKWTWKENHDGMQLDHLIAGDLAKGPRGSKENLFVAQAYIPPEHYRGELAESWALKKDPLRLEFKLRKGVYWPHKPGVMQKRELVAEDVAFHFTHMWTSERRIPTYWDFVKEWKAEDKYTAVAYLNEYNGNWGYRIGWGYYDAILPPEYHKLDEKQRADWKNATGTGPYLVSNVVKGSRHEYVANPDFWDKETIDGKDYKLPLNKEVITHIINDEAAAVASIRTGRADIMEAIRWQFVGELKRTAPELRMEPYLATTGTFIALRNDQKPFDDVRVRRAMNLAVNQKEIQLALLNGEGELLNYPFSKRWSGLYTPIAQLSPAGKELFEYDPKKAKQLLAEAGYPNGFEFDVMVTSASPYHMDLLPILVAYFQRVGIKMNAKPLEYGAFRSQMRKDSQSAGYLMNNGEGNPFSVLRKSFVTGQTWNPAFHSDEKFDAMWKAALAETDQTTQNKMLIEANRYIIEERVPHVWLPTQTVYRAWWPWVKNYAGELRAGAVRPAPIYARIWIDQKLKKEMGF
jgi:peptide/nickel transport system substrate-binding protein